MRTTVSIKLGRLIKNKFIKIMENIKKRKCYNCKHKGQSFKIAKVTHLHCLNENLYTEEGFKTGQTSAWDTLRFFSDTCNEHKFKDEPEP